MYIRKYVPPDPLRADARDRKGLGSDPGPETNIASANELLRLYKAPQTTKLTFIIASQEEFCPAVSEYSLPCVIVFISFFLVSSPNLLFPFLLCLFFTCIVVVL